MKYKKESSIDRMDFRALKRYIAMCTYATAHYTKFCLDCMVVVSLSDIPIYVPIVMYGLRLFTYLFAKLFIIIIVEKSRCISSFACCVKELHSHLCPYVLELFIVVLQELLCLAYTLVSELLL